VRYWQYRRYRGRVGQKAVTAALRWSGCVLLGDYCYDAIGERLELDPAVLGRRRDQPLWLEESAVDKETQAYFKTSGWLRARQPLGAHLSGRWANADSTRFTTFEWREDYTAAARCRWVHRTVRGPLCRYDSAGITKARRAVFSLSYAEYRVGHGAWRTLGPVPETRIGAWLDSTVASPHRRNGYGSLMADPSCYNDHYLLSFGTSTGQMPYGATLQQFSFAWGSTTIDLRTGRRLTLNDLLLPGYRPQLERLLARQLRRSSQQRTAEVSDALREIIGQSAASSQLAERIPLPAGGFVVTPEGLWFSFTRAEVKAFRYAEQFQLVRYRALRPLIRSNAPLAFARK
jgi:hypothetical protein